MNKYEQSIHSEIMQLRNETGHLRAENEKLFNQAEMNARLLTENASLRAENETLRRDVKTAVMGDSAELQDVKRENEKLREALEGMIDLAEAANVMDDPAYGAARKLLESGK